MPNSEVAVASPWPAWRSGVGFAAVLVASMLAVSIKELLVAGYMGTTTAFMLCVLVAIAHLAIVLAVAIRTRSIAWLAYAVVAFVGFVAIGAVTPISAALLLLSLGLSS